MLHDFNNTPSLEEIEEPEEKIFFDTAYSALRPSLSFLEKQRDVTLRDLMMVHTNGATSQKKKKKKNQLA